MGGVRRLAGVLVVALGCWLILVVLAPVAIASSRAAAVVPAALAYSAGSLVCHQQPARSFTLRGRQLPVCARCTGLYASAFAGGLAALVLRRRRVTAAGRWFLAAAATPTFVNWSTDFVGLTHSSNAIRALLALPLGLAAGWIVIALMRE